MSWKISYDGDSTRLLAMTFVGLDDGADWFVTVTHWVEDDSEDKGHEEKVQGTVKRTRSVPLYRMDSDDPPGTRPSVVIQPTDDTGIEPIGDPVTILIDNVLELVIP